MNVSKHINSFLLLLYVVFLASNVFAFRAITSICLVLLVVTGLIKSKLETGNWSTTEWKNPFFIACCVYFFVQTFFLLYAPHTHSSLKEIGTKTAIVVTPFCLCCCSNFSRKFFEKLMICYVFIILFFEIICLSSAAYRFFILHASIETFFYHTLVSPFKQHAVYVSILVFIALIYLLDKAKHDPSKRKFTIISLIATFVLFILLLSSKLVITFMSISVVYYLASSLQNISGITSIRTAGLGLLAMLLIVGCISFTNNPISKRYHEVLFTNIALVQQKDFTPDTYFDGIQFRLLEWRFVKEILNERNAWQTGVSSDAQTLLNDKYKSTHMYIGDGRSTDQGYLDYNTHNQFLEATLHAGVFSLAAFIFLCAGLVYLTVKAKNTILTILVMLLLVYSFNESILERQYGIIIFTFIPLFLYRYSFSKQEKVKG